jgi:pimeloyl-ACP methyl ester carboxylesterase
MTGLFRSRLALLEAAPRDYAAMSALLAFPPDWLQENWDHFERAVAHAPATDAARRVVVERIEALLAFDGAAWSGKIQAPRLVIGALDDVVVPAFLQRDLAKAMPACRSHFLPDGGHFFPVTRPDRFVAALERWWNETRR